MPEHAQRITGVRSLLLCDLDTSLLGPFVDLLVTRGLLTAEEEEALLSGCCGESRTVKWRRMLNLLIAKPPAAFEIFRKFLSEHQPALARALSAVRVVPYCPESETRWETAKKVLLGNEKVLRLWRMLLRLLDMDESIIDVIEREAPADSLRQCSEALQRWHLEDPGDVEIQLRSLEHALRRMQITAVAEEIGRV